MQQQNSKWIYRKNLNELLTLWLLMFLPKHLPKLSEWVSCRYVSEDESKDRAGYWDNTTAPFGREIMDAFFEKKVVKVTLKASAQISKTELMKNIIAYIINFALGPMGILYPTDSDAREFSTEKLEPMLYSNQFLKDKIAPEKSNSKENKTLYKKIFGGFIAMFGSLVAQKLARRSLKFVFMDDSSRRFVTANEGDSGALLWQRTESFSMTGRKMWESSTPTIEGECKVTTSYLKSDQREYYVPCPHCNYKQTLKFENLIWDKDYDLGGEITKHYPDTAKYKCENCEKLIEEYHKQWMLENGTWIAKYPEIEDHRGYWINRLYSTFSTWKDIAKLFLESKNDENELQVFYNTVLSKTWKRHQTIEIDTTGLMERAEDYLCEKNNFRIPNEVLVLIITADMQPDRIEYQVIGFGLQQEPWLIEYDVLYGDVDQDDVWDTLESIQEKKWTRVDGVELGIYYRPGWDFPIFIDSGGTGSNTSSCYKQCKKRYFKGWMPIKGVGGDEKPILLNMSKGGAQKDIIFQNIGVDAAKNMIHKMLIKNEPPNKIHYPKTQVTHAYFEQITSERKVKELNKRTNRYHWIWKKKSEHARNEIQDMWGYAFACIQKLNPKFVYIKKKYEEVAELLNQNSLVEINPAPPSKIIKLRRGSKLKRRA